MKIQKILLVWPYVEVRKISDRRTRYDFIRPRFPLGISYLSAYLEKYGYEVELLDCIAEDFKTVDVGTVTRIGLTDSEIEIAIQKSGAHLFGVSQMFSYLDTICRNIFSIAKKINPEIVTVWGGTHPTCLPNECLECSDVDYIILGEGEKPLKELVERLNSGESLKGLKSVGYRNKNGKILINNERLWIDDLDNHVLPARDKFDMNRYTENDYNLKMFTMVTSRGCPFNCAFCTASTVYQNRYNGRAPERVVEEMEMLVKKYNAELIVVEDENLTNDMVRVEMIMDIMLEKKLEVKWYAEVGLSIARLNKNIISKMKQTGFMELRLAVESGDALTLNAMKKPLKLDKTKQVVKWAREIDIRIVSFLLLGMPGETLEQMQNTANFANEVGFDWNVISMVLPLPGTRIYNDLTSKGLKINYLDLERYTLPMQGVSCISSEELIAFREKTNNYINFENNYNLTRGNPRLAIKDFSKLLKRYHNFEKFWYYLGLANYKATEPFEALEAFKRASELNKEYKNVIDWIGFLNNNQNITKDNPYLPPESEAKLGYNYGHM